MSEVERRQILIATVSLLTSPVAAVAQPVGKTYRIAAIAYGPPGGRAPGYEERLRELGYVEGQNVIFERRFAELQVERLPGLVDEVIRTKPDVIVTGTSVATRAAMAATRTIPIVFTGVSDPIDTGLVTNLARPGGNVTGLSYGFAEGFATKWLQTIQQTVPRAAQVAALHDYPARGESRIVKELFVAAQALKLRLDAHYAGSPAEFDAALAAIAGGAAQALVVTGSPFFTRRRAQLIQFAAGKRLPTIYFSESYVDEGGLMSYGPNLRDVSRSAASYIEKILKGAKPGDLPVEQPTQFDLGRQPEDRARARTQDAAGVAAERDSGHRVRPTSRAGGHHLRLQA